MQPIADMENSYQLMKLQELYADEHQSARSALWKMQGKF